MRFFNTTGPAKLACHYHIPSLDRMNLAEFRRLVDEERYFVLHTLRQTGKTSVLWAQTCGQPSLVNALACCEACFEGKVRWIAGGGSRRPT